MSSQPRLPSQPSLKSRIIVALSAPIFAITAISAIGAMSGSASAQPVSQVRTVRVADTTSALALKTNSRALHANTIMARKHHKRRTPKQIAWHIMHWFKWKRDRQFKYLNWLWERESSWNPHATNPYSGAYGIPQAVPGGKMASCGRDWRWNAWTQIRWGMRYIKRTYRSPRRAWRHEVDYGWY